MDPSGAPSSAPSSIPSDVPSFAPSSAPTKTPTKTPTKSPTKTPTKSPTAPSAIGYFDGGKNAKCVDGTEVSRDECLAAALEVNEKGLGVKIVQRLYSHTGGGFPCGCTIYRQYHPYYMNPHGLNCVGHSQTSVVCQG